MNIRSKNYQIIIIALSFILFISCKKEKIPEITTTTITDITAISAISGGNITDDGGATVITRGVCWSTGITPTVNDNKTIDGAGGGNFTSNISGLNGGTIYFVRAYAVNEAGTGYGMAMSFTTLGQTPIPTNNEATNINTTSATLNGSVNPNYLSTVVTFEYGPTLSYGTSITAIQSPVTGNVVTNVSANITGLSEGTTYHFRLKATNSLGTTYGSDLTFTTLGQAPTAATLDATNSTPFTAQLNGTVNANYLSTVITFEYGKTTSYGYTISANQSPLTGNTNNPVNANISGLEAGTTYHYRIKAVNSLGTIYGSDKSFLTLGQVPSVTTLTATSITPIEAQLNGTVNANFLSTVVTFEYGITTAYGSSITTSQSPITGNSNTAISAILSDLNGATTYHFRVKAVNLLGTVYGADKTFSTLDPIPSAATQPATNTTPSSAQLNGIINANLFETEVTFEYGTTTSYGNTITAIQSPVNGSTDSNVNATISGLTFNSTYHYRVKAVNSYGTTFGEDMTFTAQYFIGENINGGIVFYIDGSGQHGLVCTTSNQGTAEWGCAGTGIAGADGAAIGTGNQNTIDIVNGCSSSGTAAKICYELVRNGYDDWYLPSKNELDLMYTNLKVTSLGSFSESYYWSSTESSDDNAYEQLFINGNQYSYRKGYIAYVRAIRAF